MLKHDQTSISGSHFSAGSDIPGTVTFSTTRPRRATDFVICVVLKGSLHTSIPAASGLKSHANKVIYSQSKKFTLTNELCTDTQFTVPFSYRVSPTCPVSAAYMSMARLHYTLETSVLDLCTGGEPLCLAQQDIEILQHSNVTRGLTTTRTAAKLQFSANSNLEPASKYFVQIRSPAHYLIQSWKLTLTSTIDINDDASKFNKMTQRTLTDYDIIKRRNPDGSNLSILSINMPAQLSSSVQLARFRRNYVLKVLVTLKNRLPLEASFDVVVVPSCKDRIVPTTCTLASEIRSCIPDEVSSLTSRSASIAPTIPNSLAHSLEALSMEQVASLALSQGTSSPMYPATSTSRKSSVSSDSSVSVGRSNRYTTSGLSSPASSISDVTSSFNDVSNVERQLSQADLPFALDSPTLRGRRQKLSLSVITTRKSVRLSMAGIGKKNRTPQEDLEFACCGSDDSSSPESASPKRSRSNTSEGASPASEKSSTTASVAFEGTTGSCYSSMPPSPRSEKSLPEATSRMSRISSFSRRLSYKHTPSAEKVFTAAADKRLSMSTSYLSGFDFEGLLSLDAQDTHDLEDAFALDLAAPCHDNSFGLAI